MSIRFVFTTTAALLVGSTLSAQLAAVGPNNEFGFPAYYTDSDGLSLIQGTDGTDPLLLAIAEVPLLADPNGPLDVAAGNFYVESFYWLGDANMPTAGGGALLVMAVEAVWDNLNEDIIDGDQLVFSRIRIRVDVTNDPANAGTYRAIHPFGVYEFEVTAADIAATGGTRVINFTDDCLHLDIANPSCAAPGPTAFSTPLDPTIATISKFLGWDTGAPAGYLGDPNIAHAISGSPTGSNFYRVEGPNIGGPGINSVQTDLFLIAGKTTVPSTPLFQNLGGSMVGSVGTPVLTVTGDLTPGSAYAIDLTNAVGNAKALLFISPVAGGPPFMGGVLIPNPALGQRRDTMTNGAGQVHGVGKLGTPPSGAEVYMQFFIEDLGAPTGASASNAVLATIP